MAEMDELGDISTPKTKKKKHEAPQTMRWLKGPLKPENPIVQGKIHGFWLRFSHEQTHWHGGFLSHRATLPVIMNFTWDFPLYINHPAIGEDFPLNHV